MMAAPGPFPLRLSDPFVSGEQPPFSSPTLRSVHQRGAAAGTPGWSELWVLQLQPSSLHCVQHEIERWMQKMRREEEEEKVVPPPSRPLRGADKYERFQVT